MIANVLVDSFKVERIVICNDIDSGKRVLRTYDDLWRAGSIASVHTNDNYTLQKNGNSEGIFPGRQSRNRLVADIAQYLADTQYELQQAELACEARRADIGRRSREVDTVGVHIATMERRRQEASHRKTQLLRLVTQCNEDRPQDDSEVARSGDESIQELTAQIIEQQARIVQLEAQVRELPFRDN